MYSQVMLTAAKIRFTFLFCVFFIIGGLITSCSKSDNRFDEPIVDYCAQLPSRETAALSQYLKPFMSNMTTQTGIKVLEDGMDAMLDRAWLTQQAERSIDVQYFIFSADNVGLIATDYLVRAAKRGVKIRILVDDIMVDAKGDELLALATHPNIAIRIYNPMLNIGKNLPQKIFNLVTRFTDVNQRMHNKAFIVDQQVAITGGRNVADEYFGYDHQYNFRDRDVLIVGGVVEHVQSSFDLFWQDELSIPVAELIKTNMATPQSPTADFSALHQYACNPSHFSPYIRQLISQVPVAFQDPLEVMQKAKEDNAQTSQQLRWIDNVEFVSDIPGKNANIGFLGNGGLSTDKLISLLKKAQQSVTIQTPYLVTSDLGKALFTELVRRGVEVNILTNSLASTDNLEAFSGYQRDRQALLNTGINIFEFKPDARIRQKIMAQNEFAFSTKRPDKISRESAADSVPIFGLHAKSMVIDNNITVIGTFNLDPRSANLNTESLVIINDEVISQKVKQGMQEEMYIENAWRTTQKWNPDGEVSRLKQVRVKIRRLLPKDIL